MAIENIMEIRILINIEMYEYVKLHVKHNLPVLKNINSDFKHCKPRSINNSAITYLL